MKVTCDLHQPLLGGIIAANYLKSTPGVQLELIWGDETRVDLDQSSIKVETSNELSRLLARNTGKAGVDIYGKDALERTEVDHWLSYCIGPLSNRKGFNECLEYLDRALAPVTYFVGKRFTLADFSVFAYLNVNKQFHKLQTADKLPANLSRWYNFILSQPCVQETLAALPDNYLDTQPLRISTRRSSLRASESEKIKVSSPTASAAQNQTNQSGGKFVDLPGAEMGKVVVRFPPEASGYLHIGHAKAALLNQFYQQAFNGQLIMRFDDTNPAKENVHFEEVILEDVKMLQIHYNRLTYTSDYFDLMLKYCEQLINSGKAYVDDTDPEVMKSEREQRVESKNRNNDVQTNLKLWNEMLKSSAIGQKCCVRAKIDMQSANGCMRDPTIYRCKNEPHPRTGTKYKVYPTYDFACPIVDSIEGVTHTLRTMEYHDRDDQFYWFIDALGLRKPYIWEYSRLSMMNTVLSKRKLTWFVDQGLVDGWDDPRMPTVRGVLRRGMTVDGLKQFIIAQGSSRSVVFMEWDKIWAFNKKVIDPSAPRLTALEYDNTVPVNVRNVKIEALSVPKHPKNPDVGNKTVWTGPKVYIERADADLLKENENTTFINWGNLRILKIHRNGNHVTSIDAETNLDDKDYRKTLKITWLADTGEDCAFTPCWCVYFDHIISKPLLGRDEDFKQFIAKDTRIEVKMLGDPELKTLKQGDIIQLQRRGFFRVDVAYEKPTEFSAKHQPVILFAIPDGHSKQMPTAGPPKKVEVPKVEITSPGKTEKSVDGILREIQVQGDKIRDLKGKKVDKATLDPEIKKLLALKAEFKAKTGTDWTPNSPSPKVESKPVENSASGGSVEQVLNDIKTQGNKIRDLKAKKVDKATLDPEIQKLLALKADYKKLTGSDWTPTSTAPKIESKPVESAASGGSVEQVLNDIKTQGDKIRDLKGKKVDKATLDPEIQKLLALKGEYKKLTGSDWTPNSTAPKIESKLVESSAMGGSVEQVLNDIKTQGDKIRDLKGKKVDKATLDPEIQKLLALKADYKKLTGSDWTPTSTAVKIESKPVESAASGGSVEQVLNDIKTQGDKIRDLKSKKVDKVTLDPEIQKLLALKGDYKKLTGCDWTPNSTAPKIESKPIESSAKGGSVEQILNDIKTQGDKIRDLKSKKVDKTTLDPEIQKLLALKGDYKKLTGCDWTPNSTAPKIESKPIESSAKGGSVEQILNDIKTQGDKIRDLKSKKVDKTTLDPEIQKLLALKGDYKKLTGSDWTPNSSPSSAVIKPEPKESKKKDAPKKPSKPQESDASKKQTRLGLEAKKSENLSEWYSQVITKGELIEYYDVSGCYIYRPWSYAIWENIKNWFDAEIKKLGVENCYFPCFVSKSALEKEKTHIADFSPEVAWVTKSGDSDLAEPIAIRPTSETVMYPAYAKWIQSYRDLPIKLNQWNNVVRWEFKHPQPFIRTREFLWQEGHTAFASQKDAEEEVLQILDLYAKIYTDLLAIPVVKGRKTEKEKFAGGDYTTTVEAYISASGRAVQGATSHHLGQNFAKMFNIDFEDPETKEKTFVYQNSWGLTTRTIGVMIMVHSDDKGLVLPPRIAASQIVIVPCGITVTTSDSDRGKLLKSCEEFERDLSAQRIRVKVDFRDNYSPGWKFNHWELKGVPIRVEIGPKDLEQGQIIAVRRDTSEKITIRRDEAVKRLDQLLKDIHDNLFKKASDDLSTHMSVQKTWDGFLKALDANGIILSPFCGRPDCEDQIKADSARDQDVEVGAPSMGAKSLCVPFDQPETITSDLKCIHPKCSVAPISFTLFGRSY